MVFSMLLLKTVCLYMCFQHVPIKNRMFQKVCLHSHIKNLMCVYVFQHVPIKTICF